MGVTLAGHSISLDGDIAVNFYMELSPEILSHSGVYMQFNIPDTSTEYQDQKVYVSDLTPIVSGSKTYYLFKCRVAAKNMTSQIQAQLIDGNNKSIIYTYSVKQYADYLIEHADNDHPEFRKAKPLVEAMLVYGENANYYFGGETKPKEISTEIPVYTSTVEPFAESIFDGATLSLKSQTTLSLYFVSKDAITWLLLQTTVSVDVWSMFWSIIQVIIIPIALGFVINRFFGKITEKAVTVLPMVSTIAICLIVAAVVSHNAKKSTQAEY